MINHVYLSKVRLDNSKLLFKFLKDEFNTYKAISSILMSILSDEITFTYIDRFNPSYIQSIVFKFMDLNKAITTDDIRFAAKILLNAMHSTLSFTSKELAVCDVIDIALEDIEEEYPSALLLWLGGIIIDTNTYSGSILIMMSDLTIYDITGNTDTFFMVKR